MQQLFKLHKNPVKAIILLMLMFSVIFCCCKKDEDPEDENSQNDMELVGQWEITKMTSVYQGETEISTESQLDSLGIVWVYQFKNDNTVELTTNISGPVVTMPGTWSTSANQLTMILTDPGGTNATLEYEYLIEGIILKLNWEIPSGTEYFGEFTRQ